MLGKIEVLDRERAPVVELVEPAEDRGEVDVAITRGDLRGSRPRVAELDVTGEGER